MNDYVEALLVNETSNSELAPFLVKETSRNSKRMQVGSSEDVGLFVLAACLVAAISCALPACPFGPALFAMLWLYRGCFQTWNLDVESVLMYFGQVCSVLCENVSRSHDPLWTLLFGLIVFIAMMGCGRSEISSFKAEKNGCSSWASGRGCSAGDELLAVLVRGWTAVGALTEGFRMLVLQAAAAQAAALCFVGFQTLHEASAATPCKYVLCRFGQRAAAASAAALSCKSPEILLEKEKSEFLWFSSGLLVFLEWFLAGKTGVLEFVDNFSQFGKGKEKVHTSKDVFPS